MTWGEMASATLAEVQAAGKLDPVKDYLRVDGEDDDQMVFSCVKAAYRYILDGVGEFDEDSPTAEMLLLAITQDLYDNRTLTESEQQWKMRQSYTYQSIILQLQMEKSLREEGDDA